MNQIAENIKQRLSLRQPLKEALDILAILGDKLTLKKDVDLKTELDKVKTLYPTCSDFEREFPSICFSIATGVGKTRLMGACITYLYQEKGIRNFFVLAPNLTIYNKLIEDFDNPTNPKYVFAGIADFVHEKPVIVTGDNYAQKGNLFSDTEIRINIFNVAKFARDSKPTIEGGRRLDPKIKRLSEYLGQSYWEYLSNLTDLVILMDEAHRYKAAAATFSINDLKPILGIELTATPKADNGEKFSNVVYEYSLAKALKEGLYIKAPAIATRKDFVADKKSPEEIEQIKLEDAINIHEATKLQLELYSKSENKKLVKPLILVAAKNTDHAKQLFEFINSSNFMDGTYNEKVLRIDSTNAKDEEVEAQFISLEDTANPIEIVIHVFKLKEGWDVSNLYTICPLNAANSHVLIEQTIGRGLRLPFGGSRTGVPELDKLTIIAHDNFESILNETKNPDSVLNKINLAETYIDPNLPKQINVEVQSRLSNTIEKEKQKIESSSGADKQKQLNQLDARRLIINYLPTIANNPTVKGIDDASKEEIKAGVIAAIEAEINARPKDFFSEAENIEILAEAKTIYGAVVSEFKAQTIEIPRMVLQLDEAVPVFHDFDLDVSSFNYQKLKEEILVMNITDKTTATIAVTKTSINKAPLEMLMVDLNNFPEIDYETTPLQVKLCNQAIEAIKNTIDNVDELAHVIKQWKKIIAEKIYSQMMLKEHFEIKPSAYKIPNVLPFVKIENWNFSAFATNGYREFTDETMPANSISKYIYRGFKKSAHEDYKFDSRTEQTFSFILESEKEVLKWLRPAPQQFRIYWRNNSKVYEPDFVVETENCIYLIETKAANEINDEDVQEKAAAAIKYCKYASEFTKANKGKPWKYALFPHDKVQKNTSFNALVSQFVITETSK
jgi:type III restriction enzyme